MKYWQLMSPFISAVLASILTFFLSLKTKKSEYKYQSQIAAFKDIVVSIILLKKYCIGRVAYYSSNEFAPFQEVKGSALYYREEIADSVILNSMFLSKRSRGIFQELDANIGILCNVEMTLGSMTIEEQITNASIYNHVLQVIESSIDELHKELGLLK